MSEIIRLIRDILSIAAIVVPCLIFGFKKLQAARGRLSWRRLMVDIDTLASKLAALQPDGIICLGRNSSIVGAILSHRISKFDVIPIVSITIQHSANQFHNNSAMQGIARNVSIDERNHTEIKFQKPLLLSIDVISGATLKTAIEHLREQQVVPIASACLYWFPDSLVQPTYFAKECSRRPEYPWTKRSFLDVWKIK